MNKLFKLNPHDIIGVQIFLEKRKKRILVGKLIHENKSGIANYHLQYALPYLTNKSSIPLGPELPLTKEYYTSPILFPSLQDRIPSKENPAYIDYCERAGISVKEEDSIILLCTVGSRGPSSFIFEPLFRETFTSEDLKNYREELGLSIREFAALFNISSGHLQRIEAKIYPGQDILERVERYQKYPEDTLYLISRRGGVLHADKKSMLVKKITKKLILLDYKKLLKRQNGNLSDWQIIKISNAIKCYKNEYYAAAIVSLNLALEESDKISQEPWHIKKLKEEAQKTNLEKEISELEND